MKADTDEVYSTIQAQLAHIDVTPPKATYYNMRPIQKLRFIARQRDGLTQSGNKAQRRVPELQLSYGGVRHTHGHRESNGASYSNLQLSRPKTHQKNEKMRNTYQSDMYYPNVKVVDKPMLSKVRLYGNCTIQQNEMTQDRPSFMSKNMAAPSKMYSRIQSTKLNSISRSGTQ